MHVCLVLPLESVIKIGLGNAGPEIVKQSDIGRLSWE